jgi:hypothetical protein
MAKLKGSLVEEILKKAGGVFGDKGFIGTDYITTPIRKQNAVSYCNGNTSGTIR